MVVALDAKSGRVFWVDRYAPAPDSKLCCAAVNRGVAIHGDTLYLATIDAYLVALDAKTGRPNWKIAVADYSVGYSLTLSPLVIKDKVIVGTAGGEYGIRGFNRGGRRSHRCRAVALLHDSGSGRTGTRHVGRDDWKTGGASVWVTGSYDPALNLTYWGTGSIHNRGRIFCACLSSRTGLRLSLRILGGDLSRCHESSSILVSAVARVWPQGARPAQVLVGDHADNFDG